MKIIIDPYRGGMDTGENINGQYEKNILLNLSKYMSESLEKKGLDSELIRNNDVSLTDDERISIINELKNGNDLIIQNRLSDDNQLEIIYPLRNSDALASLIANNLEANDINVSKYYQRRLPADTMLDYYNVIRNTTPNETIIIAYDNFDNYEKTVDLITETIVSYFGKSTPNTYTVKKGDSLYQIAKKYNTTVDEIKRINNLTSNNLSINQILIIPTEKESQETTEENTYVVKKGDSLYKIAKEFNTTVDELKSLNNLESNTLSIGQKLLISASSTTIKPNTYIVQKGDSLYKIAKEFDTTVDKLKELNNLKTNTLSINQELIVPTSSETYLIYKVKSGDSLYQIAKKYNTTVDEIKKINNLNTNLLNINQELKIPR